MYGMFMVVVFVISIIFATFGLLAGKTLESIFPKFDPNRGKATIYLESMLQIGSIALVTYGFRLLVGYLTHKAFKTDKYGQADKFAVLVAAPTIFLLQSDLKDKLKFVFS